MNAAARQQPITVAERLLRAEAVLAEVPAEAASTLAHGLAGTALLHARLSTLDRVFEDAAAAHWAEAARQAALCPAYAGIFHARGGLAASLIIGTAYLPDPDIHRVATARAVRWTSAHAVNLAEHHRAYLDAGGVGTPWHVYDVITGLAGTGRVLLAAAQWGHRHAEPGLLAALDTLTTMINTRSGTRPGWWLPPDGQPNAVNADPSGAAVTGMAHGVAGPLALLSLAHMAGYNIAGQDAAIEKAANWLLRWRTDNEAIWPPHLTGDELDRGLATPTPGRADAWCYGIPGISRSLTLAGQATGRACLTRAAAGAVHSLSERPGQWDVEGPTLCHGHAGVLRCVAGNNDAVADHAQDAIASSFNPTHRFGFQHVEDGKAADRPGFLTGSAGVALALAEHSDLPAPGGAARWDALLLLS